MMRTKYGVHGGEIVTEVGSDCVASRRPTFGESSWMGFPRPLQSLPSSFFPEMELCPFGVRHSGARQDPMGVEVVEVGFQLGPPASDT